MGFYVECKSLVVSMRAKRKNVKKPITKKVVKKRSVGRPRKTNTLSHIIPIHTSVITKTPIEPVKVQKNTKLLNTKSAVSQVQVCITKI